MAYTGQKITHELKFMALLITPDGMVLYESGPLEGREHIWKLYVRSGIYEKVATILEVDGNEYCIYGDSGYNDRAFLQVPFQGLQLSGRVTAQLTGPQIGWQPMAHWVTARSGQETKCWPAVRHVKAYSMWEPSRFSFSSSTRSTVDRVDDDIMAYRTP